MESMEQGGQWWLPQSPEVTVPGVLRVDDRGRSQLTLIGELRSELTESERHDRPDGLVEFRMTEDALHRSGRYPRVLGRIGNHAYTLDGGVRTRRTSGLFGGLPSETLVFDQVFRGIWLADGAAAAFDRVAVDLQWLTYWAAATGLRETHQWVDQRPVSFTLRGEALPNRRVRLGPGLTLYLRHRVGVEGDEVTARGLTQRFAWELRSTDLLPLDKLMDVPARLQALVSIGTGRTAGFDEVVLGHPRGTDGPTSARRRYRRPIEYWAQWSAHDTDVRPPKPHEMPFTLPELGGLPAVGRWLAVAERYQHQLDQVMSTRYGNALVSDRLLNRVAALEGFHKLHAGGNASLKQRLVACAQVAGEPFSELVGDVETWARIAKRERNEIGHGSRSGFEAAHMLFIADAAYWLFVLCLLREMRAPSAVFTRIPNASTFRWLQRNLVDVLH